MAVVTVLKLFAVSFIVLLGVGTLISRGMFPEDYRNWFTPREGFQPSAGSLALAFYGVLFSYEGWYACVCVCVYCLIFVFSVCRNVIFYAFEETKNVEK